ncbi:MAG: hypothetical protein MI807_22580, partial [Verrucomicrobiales bacterium]|nr:hypothetical protein [Verrucomicrobiales bacterium]
EEGEALLFALAVEGEAHVFTGDKRAVKALYARRKTLNEILQSLEGRIICFEEILLRFYERNGFEELRRSCVLSRDKMLMQCFSNGVVTREEDAIFGIQSNYRDLYQNSGELLVKRDLPPPNPE